MRKLSLEQKALRVVDSFVSSGFCEECEMTLCTNREFNQDIARKMAEMLTDVYMVTHSAIEDHSCYSVHDDWRKKTEELYREMEGE